MKKIIHLIFAALIIPISTFAQIGLSSGDRIRLSIPNIDNNIYSGIEYAEKKNINKTPHFVFNGTYQNYSNRNLSIKIINSRYSFPVGSITLLEKYLGKRRNFTKGVLHGFVSGTILGLLLFADAGAFSRESFKYSILIFGLPGSLIGGIIGSLIKTEKWEEVSLGRFKGDFRPPDRYYPIFRFQFPLRK